MVIQPTISTPPNPMAPEGPVLSVPVMGVNPAKQSNEVQDNNPVSVSADLGLPPTTRPSPQTLELAFTKVMKTYRFYAKTRQSSVYRSYTESNSLNRSRPFKSVEDKWLESWMMYRQVINRWENAVDGRAKVTVPKAYEIVKTIVPRVEGVVFGNRQFFSVTGVEDNDRDAAEKLRKLLYWNVEKVDMRKKLTTAIMSNFLFGTCVIRPFWNKTVVEEVKRRPLSTLKNTGNPGDLAEYSRAMKTGTVTNESLVHIADKKIDNDNADFEVLDIANFYMHPVILDYQKSAVIEKRYVTFNELKRKQWYYQDLVDDEKEGTFASDEFDFFSQEKQRMGGVGGVDTGMAMVGNSSDYEGHSHQILIMWDNFAIDANDKDDHGIAREPLCEIVVLDQKKVICIRKTPYWYNKKPYIVGRADENMGEAYGESILTPVIRLLHTMNTVVCQVVDNANLVLNAPMLKRSSIKLPPISRLLPGQMIDVPDNYDPGRDMVRIMIPDISSSGWNTLNNIIPLVDRGTGNIPLLSGVAQGTSMESSATGVGSALNEANVRIKSSIYHFQEDVIREMIRWFAKLTQQFMTRSKQVRIINPVSPNDYIPVNVSPEDILIDCDFVMSPATTEIERMQQLNAITLFFQVANHYKNPNAPGFSDEMRPFIRKIWELTGNDDWDMVEKVFFPPPPPPPPDMSKAKAQTELQKAQMSHDIDTKRLQNDRMKIFTDFIVKMGTPDPRKADLYKDAYAGMGFSAEEWNAAESLLFGAEYNNMLRTHLTPTTGQNAQ